MPVNPYQSPTARTDAPPRIAARHPGNGALWCVYAAMGLLVCCGFLPCGCGYLDRWALLVTVPGTLFAWLGAVLTDRRRTLFLLGAIVLAIALSLALLKNAGDVLWYGHDAIWP